MADIFLLAIAFYILYKLVFDFIVPVYKTSTHVKNQFKNMQENMHRPPDSSRQPKNPESKKEKKDQPIGEYIDFEEVKK